MKSDGGYFTEVDWALFGIFAAISLFVGIFTGCKRKQTPVDYVLADRQLGAFPVAMSLIASFWSAIAILGYTAESYFFGTQFWMTCFGNVLATIGTAHIFIPKLRSTGCGSLYDYLKLRFGVSVKIAASMCFICQTTFYLGVVIYAPSKALNQVTGLNFWLPAAILTIVCIIYSSIGGVRGVVWSDVFQFFVILLGLLLTAFIGLSKVGGFWNVLKINIEGDRLEFFNFNFDPRTRLTVWSTVIGHAFTTLSLFSFNQIQVQRYLSIKNDALCKRAAWLNCGGVVVSISICILIGMIMYTFYEGCDPLSSGKIQKIDQLFPLFIMSTTENLKGFGGLFLATVFSGTLSTISSCLNSQSAVIVNDVLRPIFHKFNVKFNHWLALLRLTTVVCGCFAFVMVLVVEKMPSILQAALSIFGVFNGPVMGIFVLGFFIHFSKSSAALCGLGISLGFQLWILIGSINFANLLKSPMKPLTTANCSINSTTVSLKLTPQSIADGNATDSSGIVAMYGISFLWHGLSGCVICVIVGIIVAMVDIAITGRRETPSKLYTIDWIDGIKQRKMEFYAKIAKVKQRFSKPIKHQCEEIIVE